MAHVTVMFVSVIETETYLSKAAKIMSSAEMEVVVTMISMSPLMGDVIPGTGGLRKTRIPLQGRGKRGGIAVLFGPQAVFTEPVLWLARRPRGSVP